MKIKVEQKHIDNGKISRDRCPIGLALQEQNAESLHELERWAVHPSIGIFVEVFEDNGYYTENSLKPIHISKEIRLFIHNFDKGKLVEPFEFEIQYPKDKNHGVAS